MEIAITLIILFAAVIIIYKNIKQKSSGGCGCGKCSPKRK
ncbi:FeoB-associated Cys-rich membrane protein [Clostridium thailandense]